MSRDFGTCARSSGPRIALTGGPILALLLALPVAGGCVPDSRPLWPALTGESAAVARGPFVPAAAGMDWPHGLTLSDRVFLPVRLSSAPADALAGNGRIGGQLQDFRAELAEIARSTEGGNRQLQQLRVTAESRSEAYVAIVTRIDRSLAAHPAPGDPALQRLWRQAMSALDRLASDDLALARLADQVRDDADATASVIEGLRSDFDLSAATSAERSARDGLLRDAEETAVINAAMLADAERDLAAKQAYIAAERANLQILRLAIANGEPYGISLANRSVADVSQRTDPPPRAQPGDSPLVVIRFDDDHIRYAQPLYRAASLALERRADALFTVVAVAPPDGTARADGYAEEVLRTLTEMGLSPAQIAETRWIDPAAIGAEVHLYVR